MQEAEATRLAEVKSAILLQIEKLTVAFQKKRSDIAEGHKEMWREAPKLLYSFNDVVDFSLFVTELASINKGFSEVSIQLAKLKKMLGTPYFARIDFAEDGYSGVEEIYIGRHSVYDEKERKFYVYDWRAPISSLYYDYGIGKASFFVPSTGAEIKGSISLKRQYQIEKGELLYSFDNDLNIDDEILRQELAKSSDTSIKTIINTIQKEQNFAIRTEAKNTLVTGPAGSGKTSVGLHRLAYLLYRHKDNLSSSKIRIFSPSPVFSSYIAGIIPELGEDNIISTDFNSLLESTKSRPFYESHHLAEHLVSDTGESGEAQQGAYDKDIRTKWLREKYLPGFLKELEEAVRTYKPHFDDILFLDQVLCKKEKLESLYDNRTSAGSLRTKSERVIEYINTSFELYFKENKNKIETFFENLYDDEYIDAKALYNKEKEITIMDFKNRMLPSPEKIYEKTLKLWSRQCGLSVGFARRSIKTDMLYFEDALVCLYIKLLTGCLQPEKNVKHILLDEAQDLSPLHHKVLKLMYPSSRFTVLADINQALFDDVCITDPQDLESLYPDAEHIKLTKSYRSTYEISKFAAEFLDVKPGDESYYNRSGSKPVVIETKTPVETAAEILESLDAKTVGILFSTTNKASRFYEELSKVCKTPLQLTTGESIAFHPGVTIMPIPAAKGLEFDAVIFPEYGKLNKRLSYVACTRALHKLFCFAN